MRPTQAPEVRETKAAHAQLRSDQCVDAEQEVQRVEDASNKQALAVKRSMAERSSLQVITPWAIELAFPSLLPGSVGRCGAAGR